MRHHVPLLTVVLLVGILLGGCGLVKVSLPKIKLEPPDASAKPAPEGPASAPTAAAGQETPAPTAAPPADQKVVYGTLPRAQQARVPTTRYVPIGAQRALTTADLQGLSKWDLDVLRNEIYATHGRKFDRRDLQQYFARKTWYTPDSGFSENRLSALEKRNAAFIAEYQKRRSQTAGSASRKPQSTGGRRPGLDGFLVHWSNSLPVTERDLQGMTDWQLDVARNEIYARHGRPFKRADLRQHFRAMSWYHENPRFSESQLSALEKRNADFILKYQKTH